MSVAIVSPLAVALMLALLASTVHRRLPPHIAARALLATISVVVVAAVPIVWLVTVGFAAHLPGVDHWTRWCTDAFGSHAPVPIWAGVGALLVSTIGSARACQVLLIHRRLRHDRPGPVEIVAHRDAFAYTLPGAGGRVVLSDTLVELLDRDEHAVVVAHESTHAHHRHDRFLLVAQLGEALLPVVRPLSNRLRFSLERWADDAAAQCCGDRPFVARTLAKVALHGHTSSAMLGLTGLGVSARVAALLGPARRAAHPATLAIIWTALGLISALAVIQLHHLSGLIAALCVG